jgi:hypothetical protein
MAAIGAAAHVAAEGRGAAGLDRAHHPALHPVEMSGLFEAPSGTVAAEDVRHLQGAGHGGWPSGRRDHLQRQALERARGAADGELRDLGVSRAVVDGWAWPSSTWMTRMSTPLSSRCVAKLCRRICTVTFLPMPAATRAVRQAACSTVGSIGRPGSRPENSHCAGRAIRQ